MNGPGGMYLGIAADRLCPRAMLESDSADDPIYLNSEELLWLISDEFRIKANEVLADLVAAERKAAEERERLERELAERQAQREVRSYTVHADQWRPSGKFFMVRAVELG